MRELRECRLRSPALVSRLSALLALVLVVGACDGTARWQCPAEWVAHARGGCGPAVLLCAPGGGAAPGACDGIDLSRSHAVPDGDGGTTASFYRLPDGALGGGWHAPGDLAGPPDEAWTPVVAQGAPAADFAPDAGVALCATGWRRLADGTCDPMLRLDCPPGTAPLPGGTCTATGDGDCPAGTYPDVAAEAGSARVVYVQPAPVPAPDADGSSAHPFAQIAPALAAAGPAGWVVLAAGEYAEAVRVQARVHVVGLCAARTVIRATAADHVVYVSSSAANLDLRGVTLTGGDVGLVVDNAGTAAAQRVRVEGTTHGGVGLAGAGARFTGSHLYVHATLGAPSGLLGGVVLRYGATATLTDFHVASVHQVGVAAIDANSHVVLTSGVVRSTIADADGRLGVGVQAQDGGRADATTVVLEDNVEAAARAMRSGHLELSSAMVRRTTSPAGQWGYGVDLSEGGTATVRASVLTGNTDVAARATGANTVLEVVDSVVQQTAARRSDGQFGVGVDGSAGAEVDVRGTVVRDNRQVAVRATTAGTLVDIQDSVVSGTRPLSNGSFGYGLLAEVGGHIEAARLVVEGNTSAGVIAGVPDATTGMAASVALNDSVVRRTQANAGTFQGGAGLAAEDGGRIECTRARLSANHGAGAAAVGRSPDGATPSTVIISRSIVEGTRGHADVTPGAGLQVEQGGFVHAEGVLLDDNQESGASAAGSGSSLELQDSLVRQTEPLRSRTGEGVSADEGASVVAARLRVEANHTRGVFAQGADTTVDVADSVVTGVVPDADGYVEGGLVASRGGQLIAHRVRVFDNESWGILSGAASVPARVELDDGVLDRNHGPYGLGAVAGPLGTCVLVQSTVDHAGNAAVLATGDGAQMVLHDVAVRGTAASDRSDGTGVAINLGATLDASRVLIADSLQYGLVVSGPAAVATLRDVLVVGVAPSAGGFGGGLYVADHGTVSASRVAVTDVYGLGVGAPESEASSAGGALQIADLFVQGVHPGTVQRDSQASASYGLYVGESGSADIARAVCLDGEVGFARVFGRLSLAGAVISGQTRFAGASSGAPSLLMVRDLSAAGNGSNGIATDVVLTEVRPPSPPNYLSL
jgi:hypothetical protein